MDESKKWWQSKAVWGGLVAIGAAVAGAFGVVVDQGTQDQVIQLITVIAGAVGGLLSVYGRLKAEKMIK